MFGIAKSAVVACLPQQALDEIIDSVREKRAAVFHGGCVGCLLCVTGENKLLSGIEYCKGCQYIAPNWGLPDKSLRHSEGI